MAITSETARELQLKGAAAKREKRRKAQERAAELQALAQLSPRDRLKLTLTEQWGPMVDNLQEALAAGQGEKAVRLYWDLVDQAYGKTAQQLEVRAGPLGDIEDVPTEELERQLQTLRAELEPARGTDAAAPNQSKPQEAHSAQGTRAD